MVPESSATLSKPTATCGTMKPKQMANKSTDTIPKACFFKYSNIRIIVPSIVSFSSAFFLVSNPPLLTLRKHVSRGLFKRLRIVICHGAIRAL